MSLLIILTVNSTQQALWSRDLGSGFDLMFTDVKELL